MPTSEFEVVVVDDGSTDGSAAVLDGVAASHPHVRVVHQRHRGWPGQLRNRGNDLATGEYVFFCDADDWLGPETLDRLHAFAVTHDSDIVIGKMIGVGRAVPPSLFRQTRPVASLDDTPLMESLTPHALFRRALLSDHDIRFPEGQRRLESHLFVVRCYFAARTISVYADYNCYFHAERSDSATISSRPRDWSAYFDHLGEAVDVVEQHTTPGPSRDRLLVRWLRVEMVRRLSGHQLWKRGPIENARLFGAAHRLVRDRFGPGVIELLEPDDLPVGRALLSGDYPELKALAALRAEPRGRVVIQRSIDDSCSCFALALLSGRAARMIRRIRRGLVR